MVQSIFLWLLIVRAFLFVKEMAITKEKKKDILQSLKQILSEATSLVFVSFRGVTVSDINNVRRRLRKEGVGYRVAKKTLIRRALKEKFEGEIPELEGELALVYSKDSIAPARETLAFMKDLQNRFVVLGGIFQGSYKTGEEMMEIGKIPSMEVLRGQFVGLINSPIQGFVSALDQIAKQRV